MAVDPALVAEEAARLASEWRQPRIWDDPLSRAIRSLRGIEEDERMAELAAIAKHDVGVLLAAREVLVQQGASMRDPSVEFLTRAIRRGRDAEKTTRVRLGIVTCVPLVAVALAVRLVWPGAADGADAGLLIAGVVASVVLEVLLWRRNATHMAFRWRQRRLARRRQARSAATDPP